MNRNLLRAKMLISIHAPRTGSDVQALCPASNRVDISIHAPRTGSDERDGEAAAAEWRYFNPRSPHGERPRAAAVRAWNNDISIHAPRTGSDRRAEQIRKGAGISIHAPRTGSDRIVKNVIVTHEQFQSTLPARGATSFSAPFSMRSAYFNPRSPHGERRSIWRCWKRKPTISIHAPRTGSDRARKGMNTMTRISIHAPRTGSDSGKQKYCPACKISIHAPRTGSDAFPLSQFAPPCHFNPRSPHGERHGGGVLLVSLEIFQSTLPARGATNRYAEQVRHLAKFQSTLPARGATYSRRTLSFWTAHFNPRSPHGERHYKVDIKRTPCRFQSTLPARGATSNAKKQIAEPENFNPRSPHGERLRYTCLKKD